MLNAHEDSYCQNKRGRGAPVKCAGRTWRATFAAYAIGTLSKVSSPAHEAAVAPGEANELSLITCRKRAALAVASRSYCECNNEPESDKEPSIFFGGKNRILKVVVDFINEFLRMINSIIQLIYDFIFEENLITRNKKYIIAR